VIIYFISRIFLAIDKDAGAVFFIVLASLILLFGALFALRRNVAPGIIAGIVVMGVAALAVGGAAAAINGERDGLTEAEEEDHFSKRECGPERSEYWDRDSMNHVSAKTGEAAVLTFEDGALRAEVPGLGAVNTLTLPRANQVYVIFRNEDAEDRRLVANRAEAVTGADGTTTQETTCTQLTGEGQAQWLPLKYEVPSDPADPYRLFIAGIEEASVEVRVP
jgi:hypothetical protein